MTRRESRYRRGGSQTGAPRRHRPPLPPWQLTPFTPQSLSRTYLHPPPHPPPPHHPPPQPPPPPPPLPLRRPRCSPSPTELPSISSVPSIPSLASVSVPSVPSAGARTRSRRYGTGRPWCGASTTARPRALPSSRGRGDGMRRQDPTAPAPGCATLTHTRRSSSPPVATRTQRYSGQPSSPPASTSRRALAAGPRSAPAAARRYWGGARAEPCCGRRGASA
mmetsp:Transcript_16549/g.53950  ORF Transcript_16549/g.53950 Transcript_16549/m.53950 type:complete len:221 (+) Transcript_16549:855-1517(+)